MQRRITLPSALVIGVVASFAGSAAFAMSSIAMTVNVDDEGRSFESLIRWNMFGNATSVAALVLIAAALFAIADRVSGALRTLLLTAAWVHVGYLIWWFAHPVLVALFPDTMGKLLEGGLWRVVALVFWSASVLITVAARAWWRPATAWVTVAAIVLVLFESMSWIPYVRDLGENHWLIWPVREAVTGGALLVVVHGILRDAPAALPLPDRATSWLRRAGAFLLVRVFAAIALAVLSIGIVKSPGALKFVVLVGPMIAIVAVFAFAWSILGVARALPAMPQIRIALAAFFVVVGAGLQVNQLFAAYRLIGDRDSMYSAQEAEMWSVVGPLISITGMVLACSAIASWATKTGNESMREVAIARAIVHAVLSVLVLLVPVALSKATSSGAVLGIALLGAIAAIVSIVVVATVFNRAADAIRPSPPLPEARIR